ncbi:hypothetical protein [Mycobacterium sp.]|jgi:hypothetical protein|uniref:hypothetical protein n=1 Tax=Mycobacterium sp. TaxID=1785 RepID=UPI002D5CA04D|nr:hypothetical protein [Mycobacterium sp.]HZA10731.1 hypothetical protein [Mycobacterium sp.]
MKLRTLRYVVPLMGAAAAVSIIAAPTALAASTTPDCTYVSGSLNTQCESPGNVQINDSAPVTYGPQYPYYEGGFFGGHGGGHR